MTVTAGSRLGPRIGHVLVHRGLQLVPVLFGVTLVTFFMLRLLPGGPIQTLVGMRASPAGVAAVNRQLGLTQPLPVQYAHYLGGLVRGDLGVSILTGTPVTSIIGSHIWITLALLLYALVIALVIGVPLAVIAAQHAISWIDHGVRGSVAVMLGFPSFWIGIMLIAILSAAAAPVPVRRLDRHGRAGDPPVFACAYPGLHFLAVLVRSLRASSPTSCGPTSSTRPA